jgi:hypothetical protein
VECRKYIKLLRAYREATEHHTSLRDTLEQARGVLRFEDYQPLMVQVERARLVMEQAKTNLAMHVAMHGCDETCTAAGSGKT